MSKTFEVPDRPNSKTLKNIHNDMHDWFGVDLTDDQIIHYGRQNRHLWADMLNGEFDTVCREQLADEMVRAVLGSGNEWPRYGAGSPVFEKFIERFRPAARAAGIKTD
jgi:hypothetical protein